MALDLTYPNSFQNVSFIFRPLAYRYVLVQAVAQTRSISISHSNFMKYGNHFNSTAVALVFMLKGNASRITSYFAATDISTKAQAVAVPYSKRGMYHMLLLIVWTTTGASLLASPKSWKKLGGGGVGQRKNSPDHSLQTLGNKRDS